MTKVHPQPRHGRPLVLFSGSGGGNSGAAAAAHHHHHHNIVRQCTTIRSIPIIIIGLMILVTGWWLSIDLSLDMTSISTTISQDMALISCPRMEFPPRRLPKEEEFAHHIAWNRTYVWALNHGLTFLEYNALVFHKMKLLEMETNGIPGMILECGVAKAGSAIVFASLKHPQRCLHLFDTFEGIPKPSAIKDGTDVLERYKQIQLDKRNCQLGLDSCDKNYYGNMEDLMAYDQEQFVLAGYPPSNNSVYFHKGLFDDTVWPNGPIAYAHLDGDWYDSTYTMLERMAPYLSEGAYFVLDDVYTWSGAKNAYIDFFHVDLEWLQQQQQQSQPKPQCWTTVQLYKPIAINSSQTITSPINDHYNPRERMFRLALEVRAVAQAVPSSMIQQTKETIAPCKVPGKT